jgi:acetylglutamate kinase
MQAKLNAAADAVAHGVREVRIVKGSDRDIVTRVFGNEEIGTRIVAGGTESANARGENA